MKKSTSKARTARRSGRKLRPSSASTRAPSTRSPSTPSSSPPAPSTRSAAVADAYRASVARAVLHAAALFTASTEKAASETRLVNFLRGNQLPRDPGLASDPTFGLLGGCRPAWIEELVDRLIDTQHLLFDPGSDGLLPAVKAGRKGPDAPRPPSPPSPLPPDAFPAAARLGAFPEVESRIRALRRDLAREEGRPAFGIFSNAVLAALAARKPKSLADLAEIPGLGEARIRKYGPRILSAVAGARR